MPGGGHENGKDFEVQVILNDNADSESEFVATFSIKFEAAIIKVSTGDKLHLQAARESASVKVICLDAIFDENNQFLVGNKLTLEMHVNNFSVVIKQYITLG